MNAFCHIFNEIQVLKRRARTIEQHNIDVLRKSSQEIEVLLHALKRKNLKV